MIGPAPTLSPALAELLAVAAGAMSPPALDQEIDEVVTDKVTVDAEALGAATQMDVRSLTDADLLAIVLDGPVPSERAQAAPETVASLPRWQVRALGVDGLVARRKLPRRWAARLACIYELADRHVGYDIPAVDTIDDALLCFENLRASRRTVTAGLLLDAERRPIGVNTIGIGGDGRCCVDPRDLLRTALDTHAVSIILAHTHPGGDPTPSEVDKAMTATAVEALTMVRVTLLDHIVLAPRRSFSFAERGLLPPWVEA